MVDGRVYKLTFAALVYGCSVIASAVAAPAAEQAPEQQPTTSAQQPTAAMPESAVARLTVSPRKLVLSGPDARYLLLVQGELADGSVRDLTRQASYSVRAAGSGAPAVVRLGKHSNVHAINDGQAVVEVRFGAHRAEVPVEVTGSDRARQYNFAADIEPLLSRYGCNASGCHGKAEGQNGFKLSVFGFDPLADYQALTMEGRGRRVFPANPQQSLLLTKASGRVPHGGGVRIPAGSPAYDTLRGWIAAGLPFGGEEDRTVESIELTPRRRALSLGRQQQLRVVARYSDGSEKDVTHLAQFQANNALATVDEAGLLTVGQTPGQVAAMASYRGAVAVFDALIPRPAAVDPYPELAEANFIDRLVHKRLAQLNIVPSGRCSDAEYMRRVYLDIIGTLPTAAEARAFLTDQREDRRERLVEALLERPEYADYWALRWSDLLRVDREALGHEGAYLYYKWIRDHMAANRPFDEMAAELLTAEGPLTENPAGHFYLAVKNPGEMASTLSQVFLGVRIACAECHHHPFDRWSQQDYYGMQAFFRQVRKKASPYGEVVFAEGEPGTKHPRTGEPIHPFMLGTEMPSEYDGTGSDRRRALAEIFASPENPWFAQNLANRMVAHLLGRGLIEPVDDVRATNPPSNPELLSALADYVIEADFDVKQLIRLITASETYQRSARPNATNAGDQQNYSRSLLRPLPAEVLFDAVCQTTGVPEKFTGLPDGYRAIQLWDSRVPHYFLKLFGRPFRSGVCECERSAEPSMGQVLHLMNSPRLTAKLSHEAGTVAQLAAEFDSDARLCEELYLAFLSRYPSRQELATAVEYLGSPGSRQQAAEDLAWSLLNSTEFIFNH